MARTISIHGYPNTICRRFMPMSLREAFKFTKGPVTPGSSPSCCSSRVGLQHERVVLFLGRWCGTVSDKQHDECKGRHVQRTFELSPIACRPAMEEKLTLGGTGSNFALVKNSECAACGSSDIPEQIGLVY